MISSARWVPKGVALEYPLRSSVEEDFSTLSEEDDQAPPRKILKNQSKSSKDKVNGHSEVSNRLEYISEKYDLDDYDDDPVKDELDLPPGLISPISDHIRHGDTNDHDIVSDLSSSELEEIRIDGTDSLILISRMSSELPSLEVYVRQESGNIYMHHDIILSDTPTCIERIDNNGILKLSGSDQASRNYLAIAMSSPQIEIWNLDVLDPVYPELTLGSGKSKRPKGKKISKKVHTDAVLCLSWNKYCRNLLVSGSADTTVKLWDYSSGNKALCGYNHHNKDVQAVCWHTSEPTVLLTGSMDTTCALLDTRSPDSVMCFETSSNVECIKWDLFNEKRFYAGLGDGAVLLYDVRTNKKYTVRLDAHDDPVLALDISPAVSNLVCTGSTDGKIKVWNFENDAPTCSFSKSPNIGKVFSLEFSPDVPTLLLAGGCKEKFITWDLSSSPFFHKCFPNAKDIKCRTTNGFNGVVCPSSGTHNDSDSVSDSLESSED